MSKLVRQEDLGDLLGPYPWVIKID